MRTIRAALAASGLDASRIAAMALDGQMAGIMAIDRDWNPVTHYDSWLDTRCAPWLEELRPYEDEIIRTCGMALAFNHAPRFLYWRDKPEIWERIHSFIQPAAYVAGRLAGLSGADAFTDRTYLVFSGFGSPARRRNGTTHCSNASASTARNSRALSSPGTLSAN